MAGTILHRILSKTKMTAMVEESSKIGQTQRAQQPADPEMKQRISFEEPRESRKSSLGDISPHSMYSARKHSYASVREESDVPQSFRTRRKPSNDSELSADYLPTRFEFSSAQDDIAIDDDSDATPESLDSADSDVAQIAKEEAMLEQPKTLEDLPDEILDQIFNCLQIDVSQDSYLRPHADLFACLLVSKAVHNAALRVMYRNVLIYRSKTFHKLVNTLQDDPVLGSLIHTLDFSHYSHMGYGRSRGQTNITPYLTKENMKAVLSKTSSLKAFLVHEHLDDELDRES